MSEPDLLAALRFRAKHAKKMIHRFELSNSELDGLQSRLARSALLDLAEVAMPDVVLALLDERAGLLDHCAAADATIRAMLDASSDCGCTQTERMVAATAMAQTWIADPLEVGREGSTVEPEEMN